MKSNFTNSLIKILYVIIIITSLLLFREYTISQNRYDNSTVGNNTVQNHTVQNSTKDIESSFYNNVEGDNYYGWYN